MSFLETRGAAKSRAGPVWACVAYRVSQEVRVEALQLVEFVQQKYRKT